MSTNEAQCYKKASKGSLPDFYGGTSYKSTDSTYLFKHLAEYWPDFVCMVDEAGYRVPQTVAPSIYDILKKKEKEFSDHVDFYKATVTQFNRQLIETAQQCIKETKELFDGFKDDCLEKKFIADNSEDLSFTLRKLHLLSLVNDNVTDDEALKTFSDFQQVFVADKMPVVSISEDGFEKIENQ